MPDKELVLQEALEKLAQGEETLESCAVRYAYCWDKIGPLVELATAVEQAGAEFAVEFEAVPLPDIAQGWQKLQAQILAPVSPTVGAADSGSPEPTTPNKIIQFKRRTNWWQRPLAKVAVIALAFVLGFAAFTGGAYASEPGDSLYGAKLWLDRAGETLAFNDEMRNQARLEYAQHRLDEVEALQRAGRVQKAVPALEAYQQAIAATNAALNKLDWQAQTRFGVKLQQQQTQLGEWMKADLPAEISKEVALSYSQLEKSSGKPGNSPTPGATPTDAPTATQEPATATVAPTTTTTEPTTAKTETATTGSSPDATIAPTTSAANTPQIEEKEPYSAPNQPTGDTQAPPPARTEAAPSQQNNPPTQPTKPANADGKSTSAGGPDGNPGKEPTRGQVTPAPATTAAAPDPKQPDKPQPTNTPNPPTATPVPAKTSAPPTATPAPTNNGNNGNGNGNNGNGNGNNGNGNGNGNGGGKGGGSGGNATTGSGNGNNGNGNGNGNGHGKTKK